MHIEASTCSKHIEIESKFKKDAKVFIKHTKGKVEATVRTMFRLLTEKGIINHALVLINEKTKLHLVVREDDLMAFNHELERTESRISEKRMFDNYTRKLYEKIEKTESGKRYYMVQTQSLDLEVGLIFCIFEDPKCADEFIIYSKDLDVLITKEAKTINEKIKEDDLQVYFKRIDETTAKHLYPIAPRNARNKVDISLISSLKEGDYVISKNTIFRYVFIHKKEEIGGFYFYLLHVKSIKCNDDFKLIYLFLY